MTHELPGTPPDLSMFTESFWDERYSSSQRIWSGNPNQRLVEQVADLRPGSALEVGCGEGADVVWLAAQGWRATGLDVSGVALARAEAHAAEAGVAGATSWLRADLVGGDAVPGTFDLVCAAFLHAPHDVFDRLYATVAAAVAPGGTLFVVAHHPADVTSGLRQAALAHLLFTPERLLSTLDLDDWDVVVAEGQEREQAGPDGDLVTVTDTVLRAVRR
ncbi:class I SAM-dependent methyltransferase [soil metagenome]